MRRAYWAALAFMLGFGVVLFIVTDRYLIPAMKIAGGVDAPARKQLAAISSLVLVVVLFCLFAIFLMVFRPGMMFLPRKRDPRQRTNYIDAWKESARRIETPPAEDEEKP